MINISHYALNQSTAIVPGQEVNFHTLVEDLCTQVNEQFIRVLIVILYAIYYRETLYQYIEPIVDRLVTSAKTGAWIKSRLYSMAGNLEALGVLYLLAVSFWSGGMTTGHKTAIITILLVVMSGIIHQILRYITRGKG